MVPIQKSANLVEIEAHEKFYRRHMVDIPRIKFFVQQRYRAKWAFLVEHYSTFWICSLNFSNSDLTATITWDMPALPDLAPMVLNSRLNS